MWFNSIGVLHGHSLLTVALFVVFFRVSRNEGFGSHRAISRFWLEAFWMYSAHVQLWYAQ